MKTRHKLYIAAPATMLIGLLCILYTGNYYVSDIAAVFGIFIGCLSIFVGLCILLVVATTKEEDK